MKDVDKIRWIKFMLFVIKGCFYFLVVDREVLKIIKKIWFIDIWCVIEMVMGDM